MRLDPRSILHGPRIGRLQVAACLLIGVVAMTAEASARPLAGSRGVSISGMQVQNLDSRSSETIVVDFYDRRGGGPVTLTRPDIGPGAAANIYPSAEGVPPVGIYAAITSSSRDSAALIRTDWGATGAAAIYEHGEPGLEFVVPLFKAYAFEAPGGAPVGFRTLHDSIVDIQNTDTSAPVEAKLELRDPAGRIMAEWGRGIGPGTSVGVDVASEPELASLRSGFVGSLRISADTALAVSSFVDVTNSDKGVAAFQAMPSSRASRQLHAPLVSSTALRSWIIVLNPGEAAAELELSYRANTDASGAACGGPKTLHGGRSWTVAPRAMAIFAQGPGGGSGLPAACVAAATIVSDRALVAQVFIEDAGSGTAAAYLAPAGADAAQRVHLPMFRNQHTSYALSTAIQVMNPGDRPLDLSLTIRDSTGSVIACGDCNATLPAGSARLWYPPTMPGVKDRVNVYGSALVEADGPVLAIVSDTSATGSYDTSTYRGLPVIEGEGIPTAYPPTRYAPFVSIHAVVRAATPTPDPAAYRLYLPYLARHVDIRVVGP